MVATENEYAPKKRYLIVSVHQESRHSLAKLPWLKVSREVVVFSRLTRAERSASTLTHVIGGKIQLLKD